MPKVISHPRGFTCGACLRLAKSNRTESFREPGGPATRPQSRRLAALHRGFSPRCGKRLVHRGKHAPVFVVNNSLLHSAVRLNLQRDLTCSQSVHRTELLIKLWTRIHCRNREVRYDGRSSLKELRRAVMDEGKLLNVSRIIPGDWGKVKSGWLARPF